MLNLGYAELVRLNDRLETIIEENNTYKEDILGSLDTINNNVAETELGLSKTMAELKEKFSEEMINCNKLSSELKVLLTTMLSSVNATTENTEENLKSLSNIISEVKF